MRRISNKAKNQVKGDKTGARWFIKNYQRRRRRNELRKQTRRAQRA